MKKSDRQKKYFAVLPMHGLPFAFMLKELIQTLTRHGLPLNGRILYPRGAGAAVRGSNTQVYSKAIWVFVMESLKPTPPHHVQRDPILRYVYPDCPS